MHSRIFEVSTSPFSSVGDHYDFDSPSHFMFFSPSVDYVVNSEDRKDDIHWLKRYLDTYYGVTFEGDSFSFDFHYKNNYFESRLVELKQMVRDITLNEFSGQNQEAWMKNYRIEQSIEDKLGFRIYSEFGGNTSIDQFIRDSKPNTTYYIGGVGDYHY